MKYKALSLLSGGLDSPISLYKIASKGYEIIALSLLTGIDPELKNKEKVIKIAEHIHILTGTNIKLYFIDHNFNLELFEQKGIRKLTCVMCKRFMLFLAQHLANKEKVDFIINGDILGEQASQTLDNMYEIQKIANKIPVIRPLIGYEKAEVIKLSQKLGLYELCSLPSPPCGHNPKYPETHVKEFELNNSERSVDYNYLVKRAIENAEVIYIN